MYLHCEVCRSPTRVRAYYYYYLYYYYLVVVGSTVDEIRRDHLPVGVARIKYW